jgi:RNA-directed DNA polymerase
MDKNRIQGDVDQGELAKGSKALVVKGRWRKSGGCAGKDRVLTWGDLALRLKGRRCEPEQEVSRGHSSAPREGLNEKES